MCAIRMWENVYFALAPMKKGEEEVQDHNVRILFS